MIKRCPDVSDLAPTPGASSICHPGGGLPGARLHRGTIGLGYTEVPQELYVPAMLADDRQG
jgi:hypothetical protein